MTVLDAIIALAVPWCWGSVVAAGFFPALSPLGRLGIGWGIGLGTLTGLMFALTLVHLPLTGTTVTLAFLLGTLALAWAVQRGWLNHPEAADAAAPCDPAPRWLRQVVGTIAVTVLVICAWHDAVWPINDWDALAVYDLRGHAFARFGSVAVAAQHGDLTYALPLPPFTSLVHTWVYLSAGMNAPAKLLYATCFAALIAAFLAFVSRYRSGLLAYLVVPGLIFSPLLGQATVAYTNLPSAYTFFVATWATMHVLRTTDRRWTLLAGFFWGLAMWTRQSLDPFVAIGIVALCLPWLRQRRIPWYPLLSAGAFLAPAYGWAAYTQLVIYRTDRGAHLFMLVRSAVIVFGLAIGITVAALVWFRTQSRLLVRRVYVGVSIAALLLCVGIGLRAVLGNLSLVPDVVTYMRVYLWPIWGPLLLIFTLCLALGIGRSRENAAFVALFVLNVAVFVTSTYIFAAGFSEWKTIPDSAVRHSYAIIPVCWASIAVMPGTERMIAALRAFRPGDLQRPAVSGDRLAQR